MAAVAALGEEAAEEAAAVFAAGGSSGQRAHRSWADDVEEAEANSPGAFACWRPPPVMVRTAATAAVRCSEEVEVIPEVVVIYVSSSEEEEAEEASSAEEAEEAMAAAAVEAVEVQEAEAMARPPAPDPPATRLQGHGWELMMAEQEEACPAITDGNSYITPALKFSFRMET